MLHTSSLYNLQVSSTSLGSKLTEQKTREDRDNSEEAGEWGEGGQEDRAILTYSQLWQSAAEPLSDVR
ncbi:uncharacterized [Tachysurus ichikawai]